MMSITEMQAWSREDWIAFGKKVFNESLQDDLPGQAAQLSFYLLLALFPALLCLTSIVGMLPLENVLPQLMDSLQTVLPADSMRLVEDYLQQVQEGSGAGVLSLGMLGALWAASSGVLALMAALNVVYEVKEYRSFLKARLVAIGLTLGTGIFVTASIFLTIMGGRVSQWIAKWIGFGDGFVITWTLMQWPLVIVFMLLAVNAIYYFAPNRRSSWTWISPGAVVAVVLWLVASLGFKLYVENFNNYNAAYGSLAAAIVLMLWFYISGAVLLLGAEINSELNKA
jgi:membrane protein